MKNNRPKLLIRAATIVPNSSGFVPGMGRSTVELINALVKLKDLDFDIRVYAYGAASLGFDFYNWPIRRFCYPVPGRVQYLFDKWLEPFMRKVYGYNLLHVTENFAYIRKSEPVVVTIHDMLEFHQSNKYKNYRFKQCAKYARAFVTCSEYSKKQIEKDLDVPAEKIHVIYWGINHKLFYPRERHVIDTVLNKYNVTQNYFFSCAGADSTNRKNSDVVMAAFREVVKKHSTISLVLTWSACPESLKEEFDEEISSGKIILLKGVSDEELACLYSGAMASYFVSSSEGFGFPILESFACGTPCVTCRNTSLDEIGGKHAVYVEERNIGETIESMNMFIKEGKGDTSELINYAASYDWNNTAVQYVEFYKRYLEL